MSFTLLLAAAAAAHAPANGDLGALKSNTDRWIELRSRLAREKAQWETDRALLRDSIATLQSSKESLKKEVGMHEMDTRKLVEQIGSAKTQLADYSQTNELLASQLLHYENRLRALVRSLPPPLEESVRGLLRKMPAGGEEPRANLSNRAQTLISILAVIDEFNNKVTLSHSLKTLESGETIDARVLYWGLAAGYAADASGTRAWILRPDAEGWSWLPADESAPTIAQLFKVYDKTTDPVLVDAPFQLKTQEGEL